MHEDGPYAIFLKTHRKLAQIGLYVLACAVSFLAAFFLRFELSTVDAAPVPWAPWFLKSLPLVLALRLVVYLVFGLHRASWRFAGARDVVPVLVTVTVSTVLTIPVLLLAWGGWFPRSVLIIDALVCFILLAGARFSYRLVGEVLGGAFRAGRTPVVVLGAGAAGNMVVRGMLDGELAAYRPVALLDDDPFKQGTTLQGVPVLGPIRDVASVAEATGAAALVMALPSASGREIYRVVRHARGIGIPLKTIPDLARILAGSEVMPRISDFRVEDLLARRPVPSHDSQAQRYLRGRTVLVTGAAGSIGSELCRQIHEQQPRRLLCLDRDENGLFRLEQAMRRRGGDVDLVPLLADVRERRRLDGIFASWRPDAVFHAAAYKHVPVLQTEPAEAIRNNVLGTRNVVELADAHGADEFVLISTDKAVNPTSVMGATKRIAERIVRHRNRVGATRCSIIRFGNVLGSNGSVVEIFQEQIRTGGPVTVTHPGIERYFMTVPEAVHLVLGAATLGRGGDTFILDMGDPVRIADLAEQMIRLSGLTPDVDVPIVFTGLRPGEKLFEELWTAQEEPAPTEHPGIRRAASDEDLGQGMDIELERLLAAADRRDETACWRSLLQLVPSFQHSDPSAPKIPQPAAVLAAPGARSPLRSRTAASLDRNVAVAGTMSSARNVAPALRPE